MKWANLTHDLRCMEWFLVGLGNFFPDLQISEVFVIGFEVLFSGDFVSWSLNFFKNSVSNFETSQSLEFTILYP